MNWVAGVFEPDGGSLTDSVARRMTAAMRHRPPESEGVWSDGTIALGYRGLHNTPESVHEELPLVRGRLALVADARVDNRTDLLGRLSRRLHALGLVRDGLPVTDADLILAAYAEWGERSPEHLIGDFAFVVWDADRQTLFCARDPFGIRPLYVYDGAGRVAVASEPRGLFAAGAPDDVDDDVVGELTREGNVRTPGGTLFRAVRLLPNGHAMTASKDGVREWPHYTVRPSPDPVPTTDEAIEERFAELFREAVRCRVRGGVRTGAQLSGGLDSSAVACVARDTLAGRGGGPLDTFTLGFDQFPHIDERAFANAVLETGGFRSHVVDTSPLGPLSNLGDLYRAIDNGPATGTQHYIWAMCKAAGEAGVRVMLDGLDGDTVVEHGYNRLHELARAADWETFFEEARLLIERHKTVDRLERVEQDFGRNVSHVFYIYGLPALEALAESGPVWAFARSLRGAVRHGGLVPRTILPRIWRRLLVPGPVLRRLRRDEPAPPPNVRGEQLESLRGVKLPRGLTLATHAAAVHGVELAHPFLDVRLVEFCLSLPPSQSLQNGWTRSVLRRALSAELPPAVRDRVGKAALGAAFQRGLLDLDRDLLDRLVDRAEEMGGAVDAEGLRSVRDHAVAAHLNGDRVDGSGITKLASRASAIAWLDVRGYGSRDAPKALPSGASNLTPTSSN